MANSRKDQVLDNLTAGIEALTSSDRWREWLTVQGRFHSYSFSNTLLIARQRPEASRVAGFNAWRRHGRGVRAGEKAIWILAPVTKRSADDAGSTPEDKPGRTLVAFRPAAVFDIAQTDGEPLPEVCTRLDGDDPEGVYDRLVAFAEEISFTVEDADFTGTKNGDCTCQLKRIRIASDRSPVQRIKTLAHELAHALLHENANDRSLAELEAESVAYIVCDAADIPSDDYTFGYVTTWAGGGPEATAAIKASGGRIQQTAAQLIRYVEAEDTSVLVV